MSILAVILISLGSATGGILAWEAFDDDPETFEKSAIEEQTDRESSKSAAYVACLRAVQGEKQNGQNFRDCDHWKKSKVRNDLEDLAYCLDNIRGKSKGFDCSEKVFPALTTKKDL